MDKDIIDEDITPLEVVHALINEIDGLEASTHPGGGLAIIGSRMEGKPTFFIFVRGDEIEVKWLIWGWKTEKLSLKDPNLQVKLAQLGQETINDFIYTWREQANQGDASIDEIKGWLSREAT